MQSSSCLTSPSSLLQLNAKAFTPNFSTTFSGVHPTRDMETSRQRQRDGVAPASRAGLLLLLAPAPALRVLVGLLGGEGAGRLLFGHPPIHRDRRVQPRLRLGGFVAEVGGGRLALAVARVRAAQD